VRPGSVRRPGGEESLVLFRQLEYFVAVARERHFARAAEACYVSQPALSAAIAKLERELNVTLINRGHNYEGLTPEGERLVVWAKRILAEQDAFKAEVAAVQSGITGTLRLGAEPTASSTVALPVAAFCAAHPLAKVQVCSRLSTAELQRQLCAFELDAAIAHFAPGDRESLQVMPLYEERYFMVLASGDQPVPPTDTMTWTDAAQLPLALLTSDMRIRQVIDSAFANSGVVVTPQVETDSVASLYAHVGAGEWASIVPHTWLRAMPLFGNTRVVRLVPEARAQVSVAIHAATPGSVAARAFVKVATGMSLAEFFDQPLPTHRVR
jgi:DNA-binding transcriptional LysR family regulator